MFLCYEIKLYVYFFDCSLFCYLYYELFGVGILIINS